MRTFIYIDGFNFYYGAVKGTPYKWLDFKKLFSLILKPANEILKIKYFTALISGRTDPNAPNRQKIYLKALRNHIPELEDHYGFFLPSEVSLPIANSTPPQKWARVLKTEEKGSDVNLAIHLLNDAWKNEYDCAVIVSNDSDLAEAMRMVKENFPPKTLILANPHKCKPSRELSRHADFVIEEIRTWALKAAQLPDTIPGTKFSKPAEW